MTQLKVLATVLIIFGLFRLFNVDLVEFLELLTQPMQKRRALKNRVNQISGKPVGIIQRQINNAKEMLESANMGGHARRYQLISMALALIGFLIGTFIDNILAAIVLALGLAMLPIIIIQLRTGTYLRNLNDSIETALSVITSSYVQSGDLLDAVKTSLSAIPAPLDDVFRKFLVEVEMIDSNVVQAIYNMSDRVNQRYFKDWCAVAIQSQSDRALRFAMPGIVERLSNYRQVQMEADTSMRRAYTDYASIVGVILGCIPLMAVMMHDWFDVLLYTLVGKITLAIVLLSVIICTFWVVQSNRPIDMD